MNIYFTYNRKGLFQFQVNVEKGTMHDTKPGVAHMLEHILSMNIGDSRNQKYLKHLLDTRGFDLYAATDTFDTEYGLISPVLYDKDIVRSYIESVFDNFRMMSTLGVWGKHRFPKLWIKLSNNLRKQKKIVREESELSRKKFEFVGDLNNFEYNPLGTVDDIKKITLLDAIHFYHHNYRWSNTSVILDLPVSERKNKRYWKELFQANLGEYLQLGVLDNGFVFPSTSDEKIIKNNNIRLVDKIKTPERMNDGIMVSLSSAIGIGLTVKEHHTYHDVVMDVIKNTIFDEVIEKRGLAYTCADYSGHVINEPSNLLRSTLLYIPTSKYDEVKDVILESLNKLTLTTKHWENHKKQIQLHESLCYSNFMYDILTDKNISRIDRHILDEYRGKSLLKSEHMDEISREGCVTILNEYKKNMLNDIKFIKVSKNVKKTHNKSIIK